MYSQYTKPEAIENLNDYPETRALAAELHANFGWTVYASLRTNTFRMLNRDGIAVGNIFTSRGGEENEITYNFVSPLTERERGRGEDRYTRGSKSMKSLTRLIKKLLTNSDGKFVDASLPYVATRAKTLRDIVTNSFDTYMRSVSLNYEEIKELVYVMGGGMPGNTKHLSSKILSIQESLRKYEEGTKESLETAQVFDKAYILYAPDTMPPALGVLEYDSFEKKHHLAGPMQVYADLESMPVDFLYQYKMWYTANEHEIVNRPMGGILPKMDKVFKDFFVSVNYDTNRALAGTDQTLILGINAN